MTNADIARALSELGLFLEMDEVPFKPRAFEKAAHTVAACDRPLAELHATGGIPALTAIPGIGRDIAERIDELLRRGSLAELERLRAATPVDVLALVSIEGVGAKTVKALHSALGVRTVADLERAAREGLIHTLPHFKQRSEQKLLHAIELRREGSERRPLGEVLDLARSIEARLGALEAVSEAVVAGSVRRRKETIGDLDFLVVSRQPETVMGFFTALAEVAEVKASGETKTTVRLRSGLDADLRVVPARSFGAALCYFTGSRAHGIALRRIAQERGLKLNEYGLFRGEEAVAGRTETGVYRALGLAWVPPELREDAGEVEAARSRRLPRLLEYGSLKGDLQVQTDWTDGADSIAAMAEAARARGLEYIAITDHTRDLAMTGGSDEDKLLRQIGEIRRLDRDIDGIRILAGAEVNIRRDGTLDIADEVLAQLDVVGAAVHSHFGLPKDEMTARVLRAIDNPHVDILFHPTCRALGHRPPIDIDFAALLERAAATGTVLEIDAQPRRLDLKDEHVRRAVARGVKLVVDSDAHRSADFRYLDDFGVAVARRGWATARDVINTRPVARFLASLKGGRGAATRRPAKRRPDGSAARGRRARHSDA